MAFAWVNVQDGIQWPFITPAPSPHPFVLMCTWECAHAYRVSMIFVSYMMNDKPTYYILSFSLLFSPSPDLSVEWLQAIHLLFEIKAFSSLCFPCHPMVVRTFYLKRSIISITWETKMRPFLGVWTIADPLGRELLRLSTLRSITRELPLYFAKCASWFESISSWYRAPSSFR